MELAYAFHEAGFDCVDVMMTDLFGGMSLDKFVGVAFPGGFSYGDVLGAGAGWAKSAILNSSVSRTLEMFFNRSDTFAIGICNGCQMLSQLALYSKIIPGTSNWPTFERNISEQFEARMCMVKVNKSNSIFLKDMEGSIIPIAVSHGEGRAQFKNDLELPLLEKNKQVCLQYVNSDETLAYEENYPANPNGSPFGITGVSSANGRVLALMPHPERVLRGITNTWSNEYFAGWKRMFLNARKWCDLQKQ